MNAKKIIYAQVLACMFLCACTTGNEQKKNNSTPATDNVLYTPNTQTDNKHSIAISEEDAKAIALEHAGLSAEQITFTTSGLDRDDYREHYDIEFYTNDNKEYDYEIAYDTGEILEWSVDAIND